MKKTLLTFMFFWLLSLAFAGEKAPQRIFDLAENSLVKFGTDPIIVEAVKLENAKAKTLDQIKAIDEKWKNSSGIDAFMGSIMSTKCSKYLQSIQNSMPYYNEIFVMDNQGANVAMTNKTSDYWQGDEAKFQKVFNDGKGSVFVDEINFDDSSQAFLCQVSVPVKDGDKIIGVITFGINPVLFMIRNSFPIRNSVYAAIFYVNRFHQPSV